ncbi:MAG: PHB depolymerase family esterase [Pseudomonadota bacterium]|nr:PHB depolymerase family esterase [Pseudomonadota bacterium]
MLVMQRLILLSALAVLGACLGAQSSGAVAAEGPLCTPGLHTLSLEHDGRSRSYQLYVPDGASAGQPVPLVVGLHGGWGTGEGFGEQSGLMALARSKRFALALPDGIWRAWNAGSCCGRPARKQFDDVGFIARLTGKLEGAACIANDQTFGTGFSNGAMLLQRIVCERDDVFDAIAPVAGPLMLAQCSKPSAVPALLIRGADDPRIPLAGGDYDGSYRASLNEMTQSLIERNGCDISKASPLRVHGADCQRYAACASGHPVLRCTVADTGHQWPGGKTFLVDKLGPNPGRFKATEQIWRFFQNQDASN